MSTNWKVGDKAVCVDDSPGDLTGEILLSRDCIYLVRETGLGGPKGGALFLNVGILSKIMPEEYWWRADRFRKLITATERAEIEQEATV